MKLQFKIVVFFIFLFIQGAVFAQGNAKNKAKFPKYDVVGNFNNGLAKVKFQKKLEGLLFFIL